MTLAGLIFDGILTCLLLAVGGLMVVLYLRVQTLMRAETSMPVLSDQFVEALNKARKALSEIGNTAQTQGRALDDKIYVAERALQDLTYVLDRAEKILTRLDAHTGTAPTSVQNTRPVEAPRAPAPTLQPDPRRRKTDMSTSDAVVMPGRQAAIARRLAAQTQQSQQDVTPVMPAYKPSTRQGSAAMYATVGAHTQSAIGAANGRNEDVPQSPLNDVERDLRRALEETL